MVFQVGSVVRLKSGSPAMTVTKVGQIACQTAWFADDVVRSAEFPPDVLMPLKPEELTDDQLNAMISERMAEREKLGGPA